MDQKEIELKVKVKEHLKEQKRLLNQEIIKEKAIKRAKKMLEK